MKVRHRNFTLVELLVVMAIMAMLLYIATPAFEKMAKGGGVELAARNTYNYLSLARNYAITNRQYVAVLFPMKGDTDYPASGVPSDYYNRSYRACIVRDADTGSDYDWRFVRWIPGETWQFLPTGTLFLDVGNDSYPSTGESNSPADPTLGPPERNDDIATAALIDDVNFSDLTGGAAAVDNVVAVVFKPTGRISGLQRYIEIGEGKYDGSSIVVTNTNAASLVTVKVDNMTGRVSYGKD